MVAGSSENIVDKVILIKKPEKIDFLVAMFYRNFVFLVGIIIVGLTGFMGKLNFAFSVPFLILALIYPLASFAYDYFLRNNEVSRFSAVFYTFPIFFLFFDKLFFHFSFSIIQIIGILLMVAGAMFFSFNITEKKSSFSRRGWFLMLMYMAINIYLYIVFKVASTHVNGVSFYFSTWTIMILVYVLLLAVTKKYRKLKETAKADNFLAKTIVSKSIDSLSGIFYLQAISLASLTAVSAFESFSPLVMLALLMFASSVMHVNTTEDFSRKTLWLKAAATFLLVGGSLCTFLF